MIDRFSWPAIGRGATALLESPTTHKVAAVLLLSGGVAFAIRRSATHPRGRIQRWASSYVAWLDARFREMFRPEHGERLAWLQLCGALGLLALRAFFQKNLLFLAAVFVLVLPPMIVTVLGQRRLKALQNQVPSFALTLSNALKSTSSIGDALATTLAVTAVPLRQELDTALKHVRIGSTLEDALLAMAARARSAALDVVISTLLIGRQTGGDVPRILETTAASLRELQRLEEKTEKELTSARRSLVVAAVITGGMCFLLPRYIPGLFDPLWETTKGQTITLQCTAIFLLSLYLGWRFTRIDV